MEQAPGLAASQPDFLSGKFLCLFIPAIQRLRVKVCPVGPYVLVVESSPVLKWHNFLEFVVRGGWFTRSTWPPRMDHPLTGTAATALKRSSCATQDEINEGHYSVGAVRG